MNKKIFYLKLVKKFVIALCLCIMAVYFFMMNVNDKTLLILHSYNLDYAWVRDVNIGIKRVINNSSKYNVMWHYMNTKNHPGIAYKQKAANIAKRVLEYVKPDVILAIDDDAQEYVAKHYLNRDDIQIVFAGVNAKPSQYGYDKGTNVTGVLERLPIEDIKIAIETQAVQRGLKPPYRAIHISCQSAIVKYDDVNMHEYNNWYPLELLPSKLVVTFDEWKKAVLESKSEADFILISNYRQIYKDRSMKTLLPFKDIIEWTFKNAPIPIIGVNSFVCEDGSAIAIATSPFEQGEIGAKMALAILEDKVKASDIPIQNSPFPMVFMSEERMKIAGMKFPQIYEAFARATERYIKGSSDFLTQIFKKKELEK